MRMLPLCVLLLGSATAAAQQAAVPATLSLADALAIARDNNPAYRQALNDRAAAAWGTRGAYTSLLLPNVTASGGISYAGPGEQRFLTSSFSQGVSTWSSFYSLGLSWELSGATLAQPGIARAEQRAVASDIEAARRGLEFDVTSQYLTVLQAVENERVARRQVDNNREFLRLAEARQQVGQATLIDVRRAQVALGTAEVLHLRAAAAIRAEKLRLFERLGVRAPTDLDAIQLTDSFPVVAPQLPLEQLLTIAEEQNPALRSLRDRERAAAWGERAALSSYAPTVSLSANWSGFTQAFSDVDPIIQGTQADFGQLHGDCQTNDSVRTGAGLAALGCSQYDWSLVGGTVAQLLRDQNARYPFDFTRQPFQARLGVTLPLFLNFSRQQRVSQVAAQHDDLTETVRARGLQVTTSVSEGYLALQTAFRATEIQAQNRQASEESLLLATERYRVGSGTFFELLDAQLADLRSQFDYVTSIYDYHRALALLETAVGRSLR